MSVCRVVLANWMLSCALLYAMIVRVRKDCGGLVRARTMVEVSIDASPQSWRICNHYTEYIIYYF